MVPVALTSPTTATPEGRREGIWPGPLTRPVEAWIRGKPPPLPSGEKGKGRQCMREKRYRYTKGQRPKSTREDREEDKETGQKMERGREH